MTGTAAAQQMLIGGEWVDARDGGTIDVENPARRGSVIATVPRGREPDVDRACRAAATAFPGWRATPPRDRGLALLRIADLVDEIRDHNAMSPHKNNLPFVGDSPFRNLVDERTAPDRSAIRNRYDWNWRRGAPPKGSPRKRQRLPIYRQGGMRLKTSIYAARVHISVSQRAWVAHDSI